MLFTTSNGPAPTGFWPNCVPSFCTAVGEAIQLAIESKSWLMNAPFGTIWCTTMVYGPVTWMAPGAGGSAVPGGLPFGAGCMAMSHGGLRPFLMAVSPRSRSQFQYTACALNGVPSVNVTPWRRVTVTVLASGLNV